MVNLPTPSIESRDRLIERLGGPQPEGLALMDFINTIFAKTDFASAPLSGTATASFLGVTEAGDTVRTTILKGTKGEILDINPYVNYHRFNIVVNQTVPLDYASVNINRASGISGGATGSLNNALRIEGNVFNSGAYNAVTNPLGRGAGYDGKSYEWGIGVILNNGRNYLADGYRGQNGAAYFFGKKMVADAGGTWGINVVAVDWPGLTNPTELVQAIEADVHADGTDNHDVRIGVSSNIKSTVSQDLAPSGFGEGWAAFVAIPDPAKAGIASGSWYAKWKVGYYAAGPMNIAIDVADASNPFATIPYSTPIALRMNYEQKISFDPGSKLSLRGVSSGNKLVFRADAGGGEADVVGIDAYGNATFGSGGVPNVVANYTWMRIAGTNAVVDLVGGGGVIGEMRAIGSSHVELGSYSNHIVIFRQNGNEIFRVTSSGIVMAAGKTVT